MDIKIKIKDNNRVVRESLITKPTKKECYQEIYSIYNSGRYTISLLELDSALATKDFWTWVRSLTIGEYYSFGGKMD